MAKGDVATYLKPPGRTVGRGFSSGIEKRLADEDFGKVPNLHGANGQKIYHESMKYGLNVISDAAHNAMKGSSEVLNRILGMKIEDDFTRNDLNYEFMLQLMNVNVYEHDLRVTGFGSDAAFLGDSNQYTPMVQKLSYTDPVNYLENFASKVDGYEAGGYMATKSSGNEGRTYPTNVHDNNNLYHDDLDKGTFFNKIDTQGNPDSTLTKTKRLFQQRKINTIISRFATNADDGSNNIGYKDDAATSFGMSHGRNLLKADAERNPSSYDSSGEYNGYNNPYCRVWTHHYQYDKVNKLIRPFISEDGQTGKVLSELHDWGSRFKASTGTEGYWKTGEGKVGWGKSVLDTNGFLKIAPKFGDNLGAGKVHPRDCMFSIENLAWRGYSPYDFEKALSWEQRGPLGGRIMWFPPYGITFNESTSVNWQNNTFIGRGEDVYTYSNTTRTGTLTFIMITDHPSVLDYALWNEDDNPEDSSNENNPLLSDTDILRFFAGCDSMDPSDPNSILSHVKPTPMMDEAGQGETADKNANPAPGEWKVDSSVIEGPSVPEDEEITVSFYVFYPNNYTGYYDRQGLAIRDGGDIDPIDYLLAGRGCNVKTEPATVGSNKTLTEGNINNKPINFLNGALGYEMGYPISYDGQEGEGNVIYCTRDFKSGVEPTSQNFKTTSVKINEKETVLKYFYRVDGKYEVPKKVSETYSNTLNQILPKDSYSDKKNYRMNLDIINSDAAKNRKLINDTTNLYSLAEVEYAALNAANIESDKYTYLARKVDSKKEDVKKRVGELNRIFTDYKLVKLDVVGYSSSQGSNPNPSVNDKRNDFLAEQRAITVIKHVEQLEGIKKDKDYKSSNGLSKPSVGQTPGDASGLMSKFWRSAKATMTFKKSTVVEEGKPHEVGTGGDATDEAPTRANDTRIGADGPDYGVSRMVYFGTRDGVKLYRYIDDKDAEGIAKSDNPVDEYYRLKYDTFNSVDAPKIFYFDKSSGQYKRWWNDAEGNDENQFVTIVNGKAIVLDKNLAWAENNKKSRYNDANRLRYDQEYFFYRRIQETDNPIYRKITDKLKHFDPAYHSMTPEGFNERLNFLQQCTRQGNTKTMSDIGGNTASNLAFGRPPFCVLRLGDFYYQTIVIDSVNIDYSVSNGVQWDLNPEGAGVQPMFAQVTLNFKFIGGGDLGGPIRRLQNAMTFNYYANTRLYDNRADRIKYNTDKNVGGDDYSINANNEDSDVYIASMK